MPRAKISAALSTELTLEERRERRRLRREKQREANIKRAAKMHAARVRAKPKWPNNPPNLKPSIFVGCSGWRYWKWRDSFYAGVPQNDWFEHYLKRTTPRNQRILLLMANSCRRSGLEASARQENVRVHGQGLRTHHSYQEVQGHKDTDAGLWDDR